MFYGRKRGRSDCKSDSDVADGFPCYNECLLNKKNRILAQTDKCKPEMPQSTQLMRKLQLLHNPIAFCFAYACEPLALRSIQADHKKLRHKRHRRP